MNYNYIPWTREKAPEICDLWNRELGGQFPMRLELLLQNSFDDANVLQAGSWIALAEERVVGFIVAKRWQEQGELVLGQGNGWIQALLVHNDYRGKGIGSELLKRAEQALKASGAKDILLGRDPWHYFPGIPVAYTDTKSWFERRGYEDQNRDEHDLLAAYEPDQTEVLPSFPGVTFRLLQEGEQEQLLTFLHRCFPGRWEYEAMKYFERGGTGREFVVLEKEGSVIGFCRINDAQSPLIAQNVYWAPRFAEELGGMGPLGIDGAYRGSGYGLAVVQAGVHFLRLRGIEKIAIDWTTLVAFYEKLGYQVWNKYHSFTKKAE